MNLSFSKRVGRSGKIPDSSLNYSSFESSGFTHLILKDTTPDISKINKETKFKFYNYIMCMIFIIQLHKWIKLFTLISIIYH